MSGEFPWNIGRMFRAELLGFGMGVQSECVPQEDIAGFSLLLPMWWASARFSITRQDSELLYFSDGCCAKY